jgi:hypothetical protein
MKLRSLPLLKMDQAWVRARTSANESGVPDRLPFEVLTRLRNSGYRSAVAALEAPYAPGVPVVVFAPKESRTLRPFVSLPPSDHVLFQALVDQCVPRLLPELPGADVVFQFRPVESGRATFAERPRWRDFIDHTRTQLSGSRSHLLEADIAGFFLHVRRPPLIDRLLALGVSPEVCGDLDVLLSHFELHGVQGLPQGQDASSVLSNVALAPLDVMLGEAGIEYARWSDDLRVFCRSYREARVIQERIERLLFDEGFTLAAGKTTVRTAATALKRLEDLDRALAEIRDDRIREAMEQVGPYDPEDLDAEAIEEGAQIGAIEDFYLEVIRPIRKGGWSQDPTFRTKMSFALRKLGQIDSSSATNDVTKLAFRYPDLLEALSNYLRRVADSHRDQVATSLAELCQTTAYAAEFQRLAAASAAVALAPAGPELKLSELFAAYAKDPLANPILRRRAGLAAVALAPRTNQTTARALWDSFDRMADAPLSKLYLILGAACLGQAARDSLYGRWTGETALLTAAISAIQSGSKFDMARL